MAHDAIAASVEKGSLAETACATFRPMRRGMQVKAAKRSIGPPGMPRLFAVGIGLGATVASS